MNIKVRSSLAMIGVFGLMTACGVATAEPNPDALVKASIHNWRGDSSYTEVAVTIHRPEWERRLKAVAWTQGDEDSLVRFTGPPGDAGNATLKLGQELWLYNPKLNQVIRLPFSMMAQNWMGSDFSYNDFAKSNQVVTDYIHTLGEVTEDGEHKIYTVDCLPKTGAAVVWGKLVLRIRDDDVLIGETFYDQDMKPVRKLETTKIAALGGRPFPVLIRIGRLSKPGQWTEMRTNKAVFDLKLPAYLFTQSNLRNPRQWSAP